MELTANDLVGQALWLFAVGMRPWVEERLVAVYGTAWQGSIRADLPPSTPAPGAAPEPFHWDALALCVIISKRWSLFSPPLKPPDRARVSVVWENRNQWAHQHVLELGDAFGVCQAIRYLLTTVNAAEAGLALGIENHVLNLVANRVPVPAMPPRAKETPKGDAKQGNLNSSEWWVYENWIQHKAVVHRANCSFCQGGKGMHKGSTTKNGQWLGPQGTRDEAMSVARETRQPDVRPCRKCA